ncbi:type III-A CRISPR-associated RAMP protein Csm5 [Sulfurihydrogenibium sp.]|jgi:CRISPR type III-A-associated RAMP protein Csm5|uniref:type III-A CRISPR-associated RAMP protein Csm5 n=1 Tax=Sulfurihydrogenibium sp. TaxID=2053621 RepID=UPI00261037FD|nr:type III-A CRISPR-associated RAMP protein Csm5 [Sulfurihydrogenibium sp.]
MYNYRLKTLTPIHIGNGNKLSNNFDYIIKGTQINVISFDRYISSLSENEISKLESYIETLEKGNSIFDLIRKPTYEEIKYSVILNTQTPNPKVREIAEHIKTVLNEKGEYGAYIPGSTVKGFIRLAIFYKILKENANLVNCNEKEKIKKTEENIFSVELQKQTLKLMTYFKVADSEPISTKNLEVRNVIITNNKISEFAEVIKKDTEIKISIEDKEFQEKLSKLNLKSKYLETIKNWKRACYEFSKSIIEYEKEFFKKKGLVKLHNFYKDLEDKNSPKSPLLRIGKYKGKISQTLVLLYETNKEKYGCLFEDKKGKSDKNINPLPKTRRITDAEDSLPLGWVKLEELN